MSSPRENLYDPANAPDTAYWEQVGADPPEGSAVYPKSSIVVEPPVLRIVVETP
jgi:hypothetical protein